MRHLLILVLTATLAVPAMAQAQDAASKRFKLFGDIQSACRVMIVTNRELARPLFVATSRSLSDVCECAALITVTDLDDVQVSAIVGGDRKASEAALPPLRESIQRCVVRD